MLGFRGCKGLGMGVSTVFLFSDGLLDFGTNAIVEEENLLIEKFF